jgi:hypothetical protein
MAVDAGVLFPQVFARATLGSAWLVGRGGDDVEVDWAVRPTKMRMKNSDPP